MFQTKPKHHICAYNCNRRTGFRDHKKIWGSRVLSSTLVEGGLTVTTASVEAGEVLLHVPPLVTGPGRGGSAVQCLSVCVNDDIARAACVHHVLRPGGRGLLLPRLLLAVLRRAVRVRRAGRGDGAHSAPCSPRGTCSRSGAAWRRPPSAWTSSAPTGCCSPSSSSPGCGTC